MAPLSLFRAQVPTVCPPHIDRAMPPHNRPDPDGTALPGASMAARRRHPNRTIGKPADSRPWRSSADGSARFLRSDEVTMSPSSSPCLGSTVQRSSPCIDVQAPVCSGSERSPSREWSDDDALHEVGRTPVTAVEDGWKAFFGVVAACIGYVRSPADERRRRRALLTL